MPPPPNSSDWSESRERVDAEIARNSSGLHEVRGAINALALSTQVAFTTQTKELSEKISQSQKETAREIKDLGDKAQAGHEKDSEERKAIELKVNTLSTRFGVWWALGMAIATAIATALAVAIMKGVLK